MQLSVRCARLCGTCAPASFDKSPGSVEIPMMKTSTVIRLALGLVLAGAPLTPALAQRPAFARADTLRGSVTPERAWWDVVFYDLHVRIADRDSSLSGWNAITYRVTGPRRAM